MNKINQIIHRKTYWSYANIGEIDAVYFSKAFFMLWTIKYKDIWNDNLNFINDLHKERRDDESMRLHVEFGLLNYNHKKIDKLNVNN